MQLQKLIVLLFLRKHHVAYEIFSLIKGIRTPPQKKRSEEHQNFAGKVDAAPETNIPTIS